MRPRLPGYALALSLAVVLSFLGALPALAVQPAQASPANPPPDQPVPDPTPLPLPHEATKPRTLDQLRPPEIVARAAIVVDADTGAVLYARDAHQRLPVASLTKMVTALVALEHGQLSQPVLATEHSRAEPTVIGLEPGDTLTLEQMLYGLILRSGNDAALAIAETLGGGDGQASITRFVDLMNDYVWRMGLRDTHFVNPHGLEFDPPYNYSTAYDIAHIARLYLNEPTLARIASTKYYEIATPPGWLFQNVNAFLYSYPGADGIKTGYEDEAGRCLAASAVRGGHRIISIVLNSEGFLSDTVRLMDYVFSIYSWLLLNAAANPFLSGQQGQADRALLTPALAPELLFPPSQLSHLHTLVRTRYFEHRVAQSIQPRNQAGRPDKAVCQSQCGRLLR